MPPKKRNFIAENIKRFRRPSEIPGQGPRNVKGRQDLSHVGRTVPLKDQKRPQCEIKPTGIPGQGPQNVKGRQDLLCVGNTVALKDRKRPQHEIKPTGATTRSLRKKKLEDDKAVDQFLESIFAEICESPTPAECRLSKISKVTEPKDGSKNEATVQPRCKDVEDNDGESVDEFLEKFYAEIASSESPTTTKSRLFTIVEVTTPENDSKNEATVQPRCKDVEDEVEESVDELLEKFFPEIYSSVSPSSSESRWSTTAQISEPDDDNKSEFADASSSESPATTEYNLSISEVPEPEDDSKNEATIQPRCKDLEDDESVDKFIVEFFPEFYSSLSPTTTESRLSTIPEVTEPEDGSENEITGSGPRNVQEHQDISLVGNAMILQECKRFQHGIKPTGFAEIYSSGSPSTSESKWSIVSQASERDDDNKSEFADVSSSESRTTTEYKLSVSEVPEPKDDNKSGTSIGEWTDDGEVSEELKKLHFTDSGCETPENEIFHDWEEGQGPVVAILTESPKDVVTECDVPQLKFPEICSSVSPTSTESDWSSVPEVIEPNDDNKSESFIGEWTDDEAASKELKKLDPTDSGRETSENEIFQNCEEGQGPVVAILSDSPKDIASEGDDPQLKRPAPVKEEPVCRKVLGNHLKSSTKHSVARPEAPKYSIYLLPGQRTPIRVMLNRLLARCAVPEGACPKSGPCSDVKEKLQKAMQPYIEMRKAAAKVPVKSHTESKSEAFKPFVPYSARRKNVIGADVPVRSHTKRKSDMFKKVVLRPASRKGVIGAAVPVKLLTKKKSDLFKKDFLSAPKKNIIGAAVPVPHDAKLRDAVQGYKCGMWASRKLQNYPKPETRKQWFHPIKPICSKLHLLPKASEIFFPEFLQSLRDMETSESPTAADHLTPDTPPSPLPPLDVPTRRNLPKKPVYLTRSSLREASGETRGCGLRKMRSVLALPKCQLKKLEKSPLFLAMNKRRPKICSWKLPHPYYVQMQMARYGVSKKFIRRHMPFLARAIAVSLSRLASRPLRKYDYAYRPWIP